jgi:hypothetical protein
MEALYCVNVSIVAYDGETGTGHVILVTNEPDSERETVTVDVQTPAVPADGDVRLWARRVLGMALAEL